MCVCVSLIHLVPLVCIEYEYVWTCVVCMHMHVCVCVSKFRVNVSAMILSLPTAEVNELQKHFLDTFNTYSLIMRIFFHELK